MSGDADVAAAAALLAEPARAALVLAVMNDGLLPASELAARAGIAPSTASEHLTRLVDGRFLTTTKKGRHRYYELADSAVAAAVEALAIIAPQPPVKSRDATRSQLIRYARTCYDHLAGEVGVALARALERDGALARHDGTFVLGGRATTCFGALGIDLDALRRHRRPVVRGCLDWSERDLHVAGALGAALTARLLELGWVKRRTGNRSVAVTDEGRTLLHRKLGVELHPRAEP